VSRIRLRIDAYIDGSAVQPEVAAEVWEQPEGGAPSVRSIRVPLGDDGTELDIAPGTVLVQLRLPSGELLSEHRTIERDRDEEIVFYPTPSQNTWPGWVRYPKLAQQHETPGKTETLLDRLAGEARVELWSQRGGQWHVDDLRSAFESGAAKLAAGGGVQLSSDASTASFLFQGLGGARYLVRIVRPTGASVGILPVPWYYDDRLVDVQLVLTAERDCLSPQVIVRDPSMAPVLAYFQGGDRGSARLYEDEVVRRAHDALYHKLQNPVPAAAGAYLLLRLGRLDKVRSWLENLANAPGSHSDGWILLATSLLSSSERRSAPSEATRALLEATARGIPLFAEGVPLLRDGLRLVASRQRGDDAVEQR